MFDLNIELQYLEPQSQDKPKAMLFIEPEYSLFDKKLLFFAGGQCGSYLWKNDLYIYDIENRKQLKIQDEAIKTLSCQLVGPSMSAEFLSTFGLIICGLNPNKNATEL